MLQYDTVYRVSLYGRGQYATVLRIGLACIESIADGAYRYHDLPDWMRSKIEVLSILAPPPPPQEVAGLGRRISDKVFWVFE